MSEDSNEAAESRQKTKWRSDRFFLMSLVCQTDAFMNTHFVPQEILRRGGIPILIMYGLIQILLGIPLTYMELVMGQFSARNCVKAWGLYPLLRGVGWICLFWQLCVVLDFITYTAYFIHYTMDSFETPLPYFACGNWSDANCNFSNNNFTIIEDCLDMKKKGSWCNFTDSFATTQYWRKNLLSTRDGIFLKWKLTLALFVITLFIYLSNMKGTTSLQKTLPFLTFYPFIAYVVLFLTALFQPGTVKSLPDTIRFKFSGWLALGVWSRIFMMAATSLGLGSGALVTLSSTCHFRSECQKTAVLLVLWNIGSQALFFTTTAAIFAVNVHQSKSYTPAFITNDAHMMFDKIPRCVEFFSSLRPLWLGLFFTANVVAGLRCVIVSSFALLKTLYDQVPKLLCHTGLASLTFSFGIFLLCLPWLMNVGFILTDVVEYQAPVAFLLLLSAEVIVFVLIYGLKRFTDDVHFMLGIQPNAFFRVSWTISSVVSIVTVITNMLNHWYTVVQKSTAFIWLNIVFFLLPILVTLGDVAYRMIRMTIRGEKWSGLTKTQGQWGPQDEVLMKSRAMFSAHAMTKEYIYRQYKLHVDVLSRHRRRISDNNM